MARARCERDAIKFDATTQQLHEFLKILRKTARETFGADAQQFTDKAIDDVKCQITYLEDKPYNNIELHLAKEMTLNRIGAPDEVTFVPLTNLEPAPPPTETKETENSTRGTLKGHCFYSNKFGHLKAECKKIKWDKWQQTRKTMPRPVTVQTTS